MAITQIRLEINTRKVVRKLNNQIDSKVQPAIDIQVLKDSNVYAPHDVGHLINSGTRGTKPGSGKVVWDIIYAAKQYFTKNNKSKDVNPNATDRWFEVAKKRKKKQWVKMAQKKLER